jgi:hypothetical protein
LGGLSGNKLAPFLALSDDAIKIVARGEAKEDLAAA